MDLLIMIGSYVIDHAPELVGVILPPVVDWLNRDVKNDNERFIVTVLTCILVAGLLNWHKLLYGSVNDVLVSVGIIFTESQLVFKLYFKKSNLRLTLQERFVNNDRGDDENNNAILPQQGKLQSELSYQIKKDPQ